MFPTFSARHWSWGKPAIVEWNPMPSGRGCGPIFFQEKHIMEKKETTKLTHWENLVYIYIYVCAYAVIYTYNIYIYTYYIVHCNVSLLTDIYTK